VIGGDPAVLQARLDTLVRAKILRVGRSGDEDVYLFQHILLRDAAYVSQLRSRRRLVHAKVAEALEAWIPLAGSPLHLELLAYHLEHAGALLPAARRWLEAGMQAASVGAHSEAAGHYRQALTVLEGAPPSPERDALELDIDNALGVSLLAQRGYTSPEVERTYARARELTREVGAQDRVATLFGLWAYYCVCGDRQASLELARQSVDAAAGGVDHPAALAMLGYDLFHIGQLDEAIARLEELESLGPIDVPALPHDMCAAALVLLGHARWLRGARALGWQTLDTAVERSEELGFPKGPFTRAYVRSYAAWACQVAGDSQQAAKHATKAIEVSTEHGYASWFGAGTIHLGIANSCLADPTESIPLLEFALDAWRNAGAETFRTYFLAGLADAQGRAGDSAAALASITEALDHAERFDEHFHEAELLRLHGELLLAAGDRERGESELWRALDLARRQQARSYELRAAVALHRAGAERSGEDGSHALRAALDGIGAQEDDEELATARALLAG
jgi:tetratricopeptide (TPR) repeat protein